MTCFTDPCHYRSGENHCSICGDERPAVQGIATGAPDLAQQLAQHLQTAHDFIEQTEAFGAGAASGIMECGGVRWDIDKSKAALQEHARRAAAPIGAPDLDLDRMWDKAIEAESIASQLRREKADLLAALRSVIESPSRCVSIAQTALSNYE